MWYWNMWPDKMLDLKLWLAAAASTLLLSACVPPQAQSPSGSTGTRGQVGLQAGGDAQVMSETLRRMDDLAKEVRELRNQAEQNSHELQGLQQRQRELYLDVDKRMQALEGGAPSGTRNLISREVSQPGSSTTSAAATAAIERPSRIAEPAREPAPVAPPPVTKPTVQASVGEVFDGGELETYNHAFEQLKAGEYPNAIASFQHFLNKYPSSAYAGNAQYWLAEANYVSKEYPVAATEFKRVIDQYPQSSKVRDAQLKLAFSYYELEKWQEARVLLEEVRTRYPGSTVARLADQRLTRMAQEGH